MSGIARMGDIAVGTCFAHKTPRPCQGIIGVGDPTVMSAGMPTAALGDPVIFNCGHTGVIATGTSVCLMKGRPLAMLGSIVVGPMIAVIVIGTPNVVAN